MNYTEILKQLKKYYSNLLIIQYNGKPKAKATIELMTKLIWSNMALLQIRDGFDWKNAKGVQLDIIGKWLGISKNYNENNTWNNTYLSYPAYGTETVAESDVLRGGYSTYSDFDTLEGGMLTYSDLQADSQMLDDEDYRTVIGLKIIKNSIEHNQGNIDEAVGLYFAKKDENGDVQFGSFELSNFTKIGNPTITTDGIASSFSSSKYLKSSIVNFSKPFKVVFNEKKGTATKFNGFQIGLSSLVSSPLAFVQSPYATYITLGLYINNSLVIRDYPFNHADYSDINYILTWNGQSFILEIENSETNEVIFAQSIDSTNHLIRNNITTGVVIYGYNWNSANAIQSTDLKLTRIFINKTLVFSGLNNKRIITYPVVYTTWQPHQITYNYPSELSTIMNICLYKNVLPAPTGCQIQLSSY